MVTVPAFAPAPGGPESAVRRLQSDVASLTFEKKAALKEHLANITRNYDDGEWKNILCAAVVGGQPISIVRRVVFSSIAALCLPLIIVIIVVPRLPVVVVLMRPAGPSSPLPQ